MHMNSCYTRAEKIVFPRNSLILFLFALFVRYTTESFRESLSEWACWLFKWKGGILSRTCFFQSVATRPNVSQFESMKIGRSADSTLHKINITATFGAVKLRNVPSGGNGSLTFFFLISCMAMLTAGNCKSALCKKMSPAEWMKKRKNFLPA